MIEEKAIEPHVPLWEKGERNDATFGRSQFVFDAASNTFTCPGGTRLQQYRRILKLDRLRLRGYFGAHDEFTLAAAAQNLRKLAKLATHPPPLALQAA